MTELAESALLCQVSSNSLGISFFSCEMGMAMSTTLVNAGMIRKCRSKFWIIWRINHYSESQIFPEDSRMPKEYLSSYNFVFIFQICAWLVLDLLFDSNKICCQWHKPVRFSKWTKTTVPGGAAFPGWCWITGVPFVIRINKNSFLEKVQHLVRALVPISQVGLE